MSYKSPAVSITDDDNSSACKMSSRYTSGDSSPSVAPTESSPLLDASQGNRDGTQQHNGKSKMSFSTIAFLLGVVLVFATCGDQLMESPMTRIAESIICYQYYEEHDPSKLLIGRDAIGAGAVGGVPEHFCKIDKIQGDLAMLRGYQGMFDYLPSLFLALPFGWASDRIGRKPIVMLGVLSVAWRAFIMQFVFYFWQIFDIRWSWISGTYGLLGGGASVLSALFYTMVSDVTPADKRAAIFLRFGSANYISMLLMPPLSAWLMTYTPWIPAVSGMALGLMGFLVLFFVPETLGYLDDTILAMDTDSEAETALPPPPEVTQTRLPISFDFANRWTSDVKAATAFLWTDWRVSALIFTFITHILIGTCGQLLVQFCSKRFDITFAEATVLVTIRAAVNMILLFLILPWMSTYITRRWRLSYRRKDLYLARLSSIIYAIGWVLIGASPNILTVAISMAITSLGVGQMYMVRSFLTSLVSSDQVGRLYALISVIDTIGAMAGSPLLAALFKGGFTIGGLGTGLPFYFIAFLTVLVTVILFLIHIRQDEGTQTPSEEEEV